MLVEERLYRHATETPDKIAVISGDITVTYKELWENIVSAASFFKHELHLSPGERIVVAVNKNIEFIYAYFGVHLNHTVCVPVDPEVNSLRFSVFFLLLNPGHISDRQLIPYRKWFRLQH
jgi:long-chain acyl-CoA synthetase